MGDQNFKEIFPKMRNFCKILKIWFLEQLNKYKFNHVKMNLLKTFEDYSHFEKCPKKH